MMPGILPVTHAMPPYGLFERPPALGRIPPHRTDVGAFLLAEVMGAERCVLIKDEQGLYTADPKKDPAAKFIPEIEVNELFALDLNDLAIERTMLESLQTARSVREVFILNGLVPGNVRRALDGENTGSRIYKGLETWHTVTVFFSAPKVGAGDHGWCRPQLRRPGLPCSISHR
jgi:molybdenum storage protein